MASCPRRLTTNERSMFWSILTHRKHGADLFLMYRFVSTFGRAPEDPVPLTYQKRKAMTRGFVRAAKAALCTGVPSAAFLGGESPS